MGGGPIWYDDSSRGQCVKTIGGLYHENRRSHTKIQKRKPFDPGGNGELSGGYRACCEQMGNGCFPN